MTRRLTRLFLVGAMGFSSLTFTAPASYALDDAQKEEIGAFIREYLIANPEILFEVQDALQAKQEAEKLAKADSAISANKEAIFGDADDLVLGNPDGDVTIVEFFDYNCGYCKRAVSDMQALIENDKNIRFVLKEFPILGPDSVAAHQVALAFRELAPEKYGEFHLALLGSQSHADEAAAISVAESLGIAEDELRTQMETDDGKESIRAVYAIANDLGISGTPAYVVGNELISGAVGAEKLEGKVANIRQCGATVC